MGFGAIAPTSSLDVLAGDLFDLGLHLVGDGFNLLLDLISKALKRFLNSFPDLFGLLNGLFFDLEDVLFALKHEDVVLNGILRLNDQLQGIHVHGEDGLRRAGVILDIAGDIGRLSEMLRIAHRVRRLARQNVAIALGIKIAVLVLAALGMAGMWAAVFADVGVAIICVLNAMRAMRSA